MPLIKLTCVAKLAYAFGGLQMKLSIGCRTNDEPLEGGAGAEAVDSSMLNIEITTKPKQHW